MKKLFWVSIILLFSCQTNNLNRDLASEYYNIGNGFLKQKIYDQAVEYYSRALDLDPDNYSAVYNIGIAYTELGRFDEALDALNSLSDKDKNNTSVMELRAYCLYKMSEFNESLDLYLELDKIKRTDSKVKINILILYTLLDQNLDVVEYGDKILNEYYEILPLNDVYRYLGDASIKMLDDQKAEIYYSSYIDNGGSEKDVKIALKDIYRRLGLFDKEKKYLIDLSSMDNVDSKDAIYFRIGVLELISSNLQEAFNNIEKAIGLGYRNESDFNDVLNNPDLIISEEIRALLIID